MWLLYLENNPGHKFHVKATHRLKMVTDFCNKFEL